MATSIVDYLKSSGQASDYASRAALAKANGISNYTGSASQNTSLLSMLSGGGNKQVLGSTVSAEALDPALAGGASGRFLDVTPEQADAIAKADEQAIKYGVPMSESGNFASESNYVIPDGMYKGLTKSQAQAKAAQLSKDVSQNTSFGYSYDAMSPSTSAKKLFDSYSIGLKDATTDPWKTKEDKINSTNKLLENTLSGITQITPTQSDFDKLYSTDSQFKSVIDSFGKNGLSIDQIKAKLPQPVEPNSVAGIDSASMLKSDNPLIDKLLDPQTKTAQANIDYLKSVPEQYRKLYLGDEGYFTKMRQDAEESIKQLNESYKNVQKDTLADLDAQANKNQAEANLQLAQIEETRATNKNYLNGMLAKLGALTTTGEAPAAISRLDAKYDGLATQTRNALFAAQNAVAVQKSKAISTLESERLAKISAIKSDLSKSSFEIQKELMSVETNTRKEINSIIGDWQKQASAINKSFIDKANAQKSQYEQLYFKIASGGLSQKMLAELKKSQPLTPTEAANYGVPYGTTYGQMEGKMLNSSKPLTEAQAKAATYAQRVIDSEKIFSDPNGGDKVFAKMSPVQMGILIASQEPKSGFLGNISNQVLYSQIPDAIKQQFQAQRSFANAILRKESGAAIAQSEFDNAVKQYFPQSGDPASVIAQKKANREAALKGLLAEAGQVGFSKYQNTEVPASFSGKSPTTAPSGYTGGAVNWADL